MNTPRRTIRVPDDLWDTAGERAKAEGMTITDVIVRALTDYTKPTAVPEDYSFLDDPAEREWLINVSPTDVRDNAHRFYDFMRERGVPDDSFTRELAFTKAANALGVDYDVLYGAWLNERPVAT